MNKFKFSRLIFVSILSSLSLNSIYARTENLENKKILSLQECIAIGLDKNYSIRIVKNEAAIVGNNATRGNAGQIPQLDLSGSYNGTIYDNDYYYPDGTSSYNSGTFNSNIYAGLGLNWTIFEGFSLQTTYQKLKELQAMGELNLKLSIEDYVASLSAEYYNLIRQLISLSNLEMTVKLSSERLRIVEEGYNIGASSGLDFQQAKVDYNSDLSNYLAQNEAVNSSKIALCRMMAIADLEREIFLADSSITPNIALNREDLWNKVIDNNTSYLIAKKNIRISELDYKKIKSRNYPYLRISSGYGYRKYWYENGSYDKMTQLGFNYGLTAGFTIFDGMNRRREQRNAKIEIENKNLSLQDTELSLKSDMATLWMAYCNDIKLWNLEKDNLVVARSNFEIAMERYRLRELSGIELREAQLSLLGSEERLSTIEYNIKLCEISLLQLSGDILNNISL